MTSVSHRTQLAATAVGASLLTFTLLQLYNSHNRRVKRRESDRDIHRSLEAHDFPKPQVDEEYLSEADEFTSLSSQNDQKKPEKVPSSLDYDQGLIREQLARNYAFFGDEGMKKIRGGTVVIVGCGGVGSWAAVMLVRS